MADRHHRRPRARLVVGSLVCVLALAGSYLWWSSSQDPLKLPASACWSLLDRNDLRPLAAKAQGTFAVHYTKDGFHSIGQQATIQPGERTQYCAVSRDSEHYESLLDVTVHRINRLDYRNIYEEEPSPDHRAKWARLDLGPDVKGLWGMKEQVQVAFRCDSPANVDPGYPYLEVMVGAWSEQVDPKQASVHQARLDIALKVARAAAAARPCQNPVAFPSADVARKVLETAFQGTAMTQAGSGAPSTQAAGDR
ncbi:hypothetical protein [Streptomyces sp. CB01881]|uniref:hypothetical protein n=1 Tax=Streptomyces sp. CB01881 TaxID=2078691 RepID=UPI000CDC8D9A|nr:hypothetical protein [Streptomyces sp. CB01881]AUY52305.1 hypothetical protein C2142_29060 [Streptomyces sp. CB01881]TYC71727.1 hypothetical protein EH183_29040 [Streptomyces sp. CB01881]